MEIGLRLLMGREHAPPGWKKFLSPSIITLRRYFREGVVCIFARYDVRDVPLVGCPGFLKLRKTLD